jgi:hypothetical protein
VHYALRNSKTLSRQKFDCPIFKVNDESTLYHIEEFIFLIVFMPVELALHNAKPDDAIIYPTQRLVIPGLCDRIDKLLKIYEFQGSITRVEMDGIGFLSIHNRLLV